ncbi:MAG: hypothetical protein FWG83_07165 [Oscillospiraceae bacterium]|nr:hypothetical protein [Oscillospiraceae bacterium]
MKQFAFTALCVILGVIFVSDSQGISVSVAESIRLCLVTVIPSLFAFLALSTFVMSSGLIKGETSLFLLSMLGGYPVGAKLLSDKVKENPDYKIRAENMLMYCFNGSPVFLMALSNIGIYIWLSNVLACTIFAAIANSGKSAKPRRQNHKHKSAVAITGDNLTSSIINAVTSSGTALYKICIMVVFFGIISRTLRFLPQSIHSFLEITNIMELQANPALISALTSMGGICIIFQVSAICGGTKINLKKFLLARIPIAALSSGIFALLARIFEIGGETAIQTLANPNRIEITSGGSIPASICLLIMTLILLRKSPSSYK